MNEKKVDFAVMPSGNIMVFPVVDMPRKELKRNIRQFLSQTGYTQEVQWGRLTHEDVNRRLDDIEEATGDEVWLDDWTGQHAGDFVYASKPERRAS